MLAEQVLALIIFISMFVLIVLDAWMWGIDADWGIWNYHEVAGGGY